MADNKNDGKLKHSRGGVTTRDDVTDLGVAMLPGSPDEPQGPEDALGPGKKRGDYAGRVGPERYDPHQIVPREDVKDGEPQVEVVAQRDRASQRGDEKSLKGGVDTV